MGRKTKIFIDGEFYDVYRQDPQDRLNYGWDYSKLVGSGDRLNTSTWAIDGIAYANVDPIPSDVTVRILEDAPHNPTMTDTQTTVWLESGGLNLAFFVRNSIQTELGLKKDSTFILEIMRQ
jgi:hypothetical protein